MDGNRFDDLSRKLATGMSRRKALAGIAAGIAGALGLRGAAEAEVSQGYCGNVSCRTNPGKCKVGCVCCIWENGNSRCVPPSLCTGTVACPPGKVFDPARGGCVDPCTGTGTPGNCPPPAATSCQVVTCPANGICAYTPAPNNTACGAGKACCDGTCTSLGTVSNCASCGNVCTANQVCGNGACTCPNDSCGATCCAPGQVCIGGVCSPRGGPGDACDTTGANDCQTGLTCCGGFCRNLQTDPDFCGACTTDCADPAAGTCQGARTCTAGVCGFAPAAANTVCRASTGPCDPAEVCTGSSLTCPTDAKTPTGQPGTCPSGQVCCGGACTTLGTLTNCEGCGDICATNEVCDPEDGCTCPTEVCGAVCCATGTVCIGGTCTSRGGPGDACDAGQSGDCQTGLTCCNGFCRNLQTDPDFCGACTTDCADPNPGNCEGARTCTAGVCGFAPAAANTVCRASTGPCDPAEVCNGSALGCPANALTPPGQPGTCPSGQVCCGGACTQVGTVTNCETCGDICLANEVCTSVAAGCTCPNATCNGACCAAGQVCIGNVCSPRSPEGGVCDAGQDGDCQAGLTCCNGTCRNLQTNPDFCGTCGTTCASAQAGTCQGARTCTAGVCGHAPAAANTVCRASTGPCDLQEVCDGSLLTCPADAKAAVGTTCGTCLLCDGAGNCNVTDTTSPGCVVCGGAGSTGCTGDIGTQGSCCSGLICNGLRVCEAPCDPNDPTAGCLCGVDSGVCPPLFPCCISAGNSLRRCGNNNGNQCACEDDTSCEQLDQRKICCAGFCRVDCPA